ncbi:MAG: cyclic nucleotide-binding domain-containing protein [Desulfobacteraceae bacterium]|nr:cyclic nucleotide-binding domain-containing protein [Desulfobacteraceae bacterium]
MVSKEDLKKIVMLSYLSDDSLEKLVPMTDSLRFDQGETIFRQGDVTDRLYMLERGKVLLEQRISDKVTASLGAIKPGYSFGWSAMLDEGDTYTSDAVCAEKCEVFSIRREKMINLFNEDHTIGYILSQRLLRVIKKRLDHRTEQFLRAIKNQPDIQALLDS